MERPSFPPPCRSRDAGTGVQLTGWARNRRTGMIPPLAPGVLVAPRGSWLLHLRPSQRPKGELVAWLGDALPLRPGAGATQRKAGKPGQRTAEVAGGWWCVLRGAHLACGDLLLAAIGAYQVGGWRPCGQHSWSTGAKGLQLPSFLQPWCLKVIKLEILAKILSLFFLTFSFSVPH